MKQIIAILMLLALALSVQAAGGAMVKAQILRYEPTPAEQGNTVDIWIELSNAGTRADRVAVKFVPEYPFSMPAGQAQQVDVGTIAATESKVVKFTVFVDSNAPNGDRDIKFQFKYGSDEWTELETPISLQTQQGAALLVQDYTVTPSPAAPGQAVTVKLTLANTGRTLLKNIDVSLDIADTFSTVGSGTKKRVDMIDAGETAEVSFQLASDPSTEVKLYNIPVSLVYKDDRNNQYNETAKISLLVNAKPELSLTVDKTDFADKKSAGTVSVKVVNKGVVNLKYVTVRLVQTDQYEVLSPSNEAYVGNLDSDDFETVDFTVKPLVDSPRLNVQLEFKDPYNTDFSQQYDLPVRIITDKDLGKAGTPWGVIAVVLVLVVGGILYWRRRKKAKK